MVGWEDVFIRAHGRKFNPMVLSKNIYFIDGDVRVGRYLNVAWDGDPKEGEFYVELARAFKASRGMWDDHEKTASAIIDHFCSTFPTLDKTTSTKPSQTVSDYVTVVDLSGPEPTTYEVLSGEERKPMSLLLPEPSFEEFIDDWVPSKDR